MNKKLILFCVLIFSGLGAFAKSADSLAETITLDKAIDISTKNNPLLLTAEQDIIIAKQRIKEARFMALPQFSLAGTLTRLNLEYPMVLPQEFGGRYLDNGISDDFYGMRAYAFQPIYTGGRNRSALRIAKTAYKEAKVKYETVERDAILDTKKAFYTFIFKKKIFELNDFWCERFNRLSAGIKKDKWEAIEIKAFKSALESAKKKCEKDLRLAGIKFKKILGRQTIVPINIIGDFELNFVDIDINKSLITAMKKRSELKSEIYKAQIDEIAVNMAMVKRYPNIYMGASYDIVGHNALFSGDSVRSNNWTASLAIQLPIPWDKWTQVSQKRAQQRKGDLKRSALEDAIRYETITANKNLDFWQTEVKKRKIVLLEINKEYENSIRKSAMPISALRTLKAVRDFNENYIEAVYEQAMAKINLEWAQGRDLSE